MKRMVKMTTLALLAVTFLAACGKKGSNGKSVATTGLTASCTNCQNLTTDVMMRGAVKNATQALTGQIDLHGDRAAMEAARARSAQAGNQSPPVVFYSGPVIASGQITVATPVYLGNCVIPPGAYQVRTLQMGQMNQTVFGNLDLVLDGPRDLRVRIPLGEPWSQYQRLYLEVVGVDGPLGFNPSAQGSCGTTPMVLN